MIESTEQKLQQKSTQRKKKKLVRQQDAYLAIRPAMTNKCVSRTDAPFNHAIHHNPPFTFQTDFPRGTDFTVFLQYRDGYVN